MSFPLNPCCYRAGRLAPDHGRLAPDHGRSVEIRPEPKQVPPADQDDVMVPLFIGFGDAVNHSRTIEMTSACCHKGLFPQQQ